MAITNPNEITGLAAHLTASSLSLTDGDPISTWADETANNNDATAAGVDRPTYRDGTNFAHGLPTVEYVGPGHRLEIPTDASLENGQVTYAVVARQSDLRGNADPFWLINKVNTSNPSTIGIRAVDDGVTNEGKYEAFFRLNGSEGTARDIVSNGPQGQSWKVFIFRYDGSTGELYIDGDLAGSNAQAGAIDTDSGGNLVIGNHPSVDNGWVGQIAEVVVYDNSISNTDRDDLYTYLRDRYNPTTFVKQSSILADGIRHVRIRTASETNQTHHQMLAVTTAGAVNHYTAPTTAPHTWTLQYSSVIPTNASYRTLDFLVVGGKWYVYMDLASGNGNIELWTGNNVDSLVEHASSPIIVGFPSNFHRVPGVYQESGSWTMLIDIRTDSITGEVGRIDRWTSDDGVCWCRDNVNSPVVNFANNGFEHSDVGHPFIYKDTSGKYAVVYAGFNEDHSLATTFFPHEIGILESTDLITFTRPDPKTNPILGTSHGSSDFDVRFVANPCFFHDGTNLNLYYSGMDTSGNIQPGYAQGNSQLFSS